MSSVLPIDQIRTDGGMQPRDHISDDVVKRYIEDMTNGAEFPPVTTFFDGTDYWLSDGYHRLTASRCLERSEIVAEVHQGTRRDAVLHSVGANATHGYPRSNADKRRAVLTLLKDDEWSQWSDREIARRSAVGPPLVARIREEFTVTNYSERTYTTKHGTEAVMNTVNIGTHKPSNVEPLPPPPFPPEHAPVSGRIAWLLSELAKSLTINPSEFAEANSWSRHDIRDYTRVIVAWASELEQELEDEAA